MRTATRKWLALGLAWTGWWLGGAAEAASPARLNINVDVTANLSVNVNGVASSTHTAAWNTATANAKLVSATSATVTNDSGGQTEKWALSSGNSIAQSGTDNWSLATSSTAVGADKFALQAVFASSNTTAGNCPDSSSGTWNAAKSQLLTGSPVTYDSNTFVAAVMDEGGGTPNPDVTGGAANGRMLAGNKRALCWRVVTPDSSGTANDQTIQITVTAQNP